MTIDKLMSTHAYKERQTHAERLTNRQTVNIHHYTNQIQNKKITQT